MRPSYIYLLQTQTERVLELLNSLIAATNTSPEKVKTTVDETASAIFELVEFFRVIASCTFSERDDWQELDLLKDIEFLVARLALPDLQSLPADSPFLFKRALNLKTLVGAKIRAAAIKVIADRDSSLPTDTKRLLDYRAARDLTFSGYFPLASIN